MAWNGSGTYTRTNGVNTGTEVWQDDAAAGTKIVSDRHDVHDQDLATAINACLTKNNESKPTSNFDPAVTSSLDLGDNTLRWQHLYSEGVNFPATQVASADANTLDDYEEGTFTPTIQDTSLSDAESQTYTTQTGYYTKIGQQVTFHLDIEINSLGTLATGVQAFISLGALPVEGKSADVAVNIGYGTSLAIVSAYPVTVAGYIGSGTNVINLTKWSVIGAGSANFTITDLSAGGRLVVSGSYFV